jgi:outer membrane protein, heavy metal efflux system
MLCLCAMLMAALHAGEPDQFHTLSLEQALQLAEQQHPDLAEARALADAAGGRAQQAGLLPNPDLIGRIEALPLERNSNRHPDYLIGLSQTVPLGGRLGSARQAGNWEQLRFSREIELKRVEIRKAVHRAFATALYQETAVNLQTGIAAGLQSAVDIARHRVDQGDATPDELARAELELARGQIELQRSQALREQADAGLAAAVGVPDLVVENLDGGLENVFELATIESVAVDLENSPAMDLAWASVEESRAGIDLVKAERIPDVRVEVLYRRLETDKENSIDLGLSIPLPIFNRGAGQMRAARAELAAAEARARASAVEVIRRFRESQSQLASALDQASTLRTVILPRAEAIRTTMQRRYDAGDASLAELIPVSRDWAALQLTYLEALRDVMGAWTELRSLAGLL